MTNMIFYVTIYFEQGVLNWYVLQGIMKTREDRKKVVKMS